jgi:hypothetical protein
MALKQLHWFVRIYGPTLPQKKTEAQAIIGESLFGAGMPQVQCRVALSVQEARVGLAVGASEPATCEASAMPCLRLDLGIHVTPLGGGAVRRGSLAPPADHRCSRLLQLALPLRQPRTDLVERRRNEVCIHKF